MRRALTLLFALALACGQPRPRGQDGGAADAGAAPDSGRVTDAGQDAGSDSGGDAGGSDAGIGMDAGFDGGGDAGGIDAGSQTTFNGYVYDFANNRQPLPGVQVFILNGNSATVTDATGNFHLPVPPRVPFTTEMQDVGYATSYLPQLDLSSSLTSPIGMPMFNNQQVAAIQNSLPNFNAADGLVFASVTTLAAAGPCTDQSGWTFQISPSGGESITYLDATGNPNPTQTSTGSFGFALIYNVNPAVSPVALIASKPDAGCAMPGPGMGVTGNVEIAPQIVSFGIIFIQ